MSYVGVTKTTNSSQYISILKFKTVSKRELQIIVETIVLQHILMFLNYAYLY